MSSSVLLIAIGNTLRRDDGAGHELAARLEPFLRAAGVSVEVEYLQQLVPETAEIVSKAVLAVFLDASRDGTENQPRMIPVQPDAKTEPASHSISPQQVLSIAERLFHHRPLAYLLTIPGRDFEHGEEFSDVSQNGIADATEYWRDIVRIVTGDIGLSSTETDMQHPTKNP